MCVYITAVVPASALTAPFADVVTQHRLAFSACDNPFVQRQLKPTERYLDATNSVCDCASALFGDEAPVPRTQKQIDREVARLRRKKWNEKKIARWLKDTDVDPDAPFDPPRHVDPHGPDWASFLEGALGLRGVSYIGLVGHSYAGGPQSEEIVLTARARHTVQELRDGTLRALARDVIHEFRTIDYARHVW
jgi:hypothetical protein